MAWVSERKDVLSSALGLLTLLAYIRYARAPRWYSYVPIVILLALSLLAKPMLVTLPFLFLLLDYWPLMRGLNLNSFSPGWAMEAAAVPRFPRRSFPALLLEKIPLLVLVAVCGVITIIAQNGSNAVSTLDELSIARRLEDVPLAYVGYLGKIIWPERLSIFYPLANHAPPRWALCSAALLLVLITALSLSQWRRRPWLLVGWLWFLGALAPVIGVVQVGAQALADRYSYLPNVGLLVMAVWSIPARWWLQPAPRLALLGASGALLAWLSAATWVQTGYWRDSTQLWNHAIRVTIPNPVAFTYYANALVDQGHAEEALPWYRKALATSPLFQPALKGMGVLLAQEDRFPEAVQAYQMFLSVNPDDALVQMNLGAALGRLGRHQEAEKHLQLSVKLDPLSADAHFDLGVELNALGQSRQAVEEFQQALAINPGQALARLHWGRALAAMGQWQAAVGQYQQAVALQPDLAEAHNSLGVALARTGQPDRAVEQFHQALRLRPDYDDARDNLKHALTLLQPVGKQ